MRLIDNERAFFSDRKSFHFPSGMASDGVVTPSESRFWLNISDFALVIGDIGFRAVGKKRKAQRINGEMSFDAVGTFVKAKAFGFNTGIAGILHSL